MSDEGKQEPVNESSEATTENDATHMAGAERMPASAQPDHQSSAPRRPLFRH